MTSEVVIKQYPDKIVINNPGGFPKGVNVDNILTVSSTPRSRLITEVLEKTGLVERSGQGVDKIYSISITEGKALPDYTQSNMFQVSLTLQGEIIDKAFHIFINQYQLSYKEPKLGVEQIITLSKIRDGKFQDLDAAIVGQLEGIQLVERVSGHTNRYALGQDYQSLSAASLRIGKRYLVKDIELLLPELQGKSPKIGELEAILSASLNRNQIKFLLEKLLEDKVMSTEGVGRGTKYVINTPFSTHKGQDLIKEVVNHLRDIHE